MNEKIHNDIISNDSGLHEYNLNVKKQYKAKQTTFQHPYLVPIKRPHLIL
jgi:hypothetical protein